MGLKRGTFRLTREFEPWMIEALRFHVESGCSVRSFFGKYKIHPVTFGQWLNDIPEMRAINLQYKAYINEKRRSKINWRNGNVDSQET